MESTGNSNRASKSSGFLKTTTWGTLIAASVLAAAWGFNGHFAGSSGNFGTNLHVAKLNPAKVQPAGKSGKLASSPASESNDAKTASSIVSAPGQAANPNPSYSFTSHSSTASGAA